MIKVAIVGFGNIGKAVYEAVKRSEDLALSCVVSSRDVDVDVPVIKNIDDLKDVDVAILCSPSRSVPELASKLLSKGICTADSYDIHTNIAEVRLKLDAVAKENNASAIMSAGWDPAATPL